MFFIFVFFIIVALILLALVLKMKAVINVDNGNITVIIIIFGFIKLRTNYIIKYEKEKILILFKVTRGRVKPVFDLFNIIFKIRKTIPAYKTFYDLIKSLAKFIRKKRKKGAFSYIYKKIKYHLNINLYLGINDAFATAMTCGLLGAASSAASSIYNDKMHRSSIIITPEFSKQAISIKADCIIMLAPADIIIGYVIYKKTRGGEIHASY